MRRLKGKVLLKGRRITDKKEDYYQGSAYDSDTDDSEIEEEHTKRMDTMLYFYTCIKREICGKSIFFSIS